MSYRLPPKRVSDAFYQITLDTFPALKSNRIYRRFFQYLLFSSRTNDYGYINICLPILAEIELKYDKFLNHKYFNGNTLLESFKRDVLPDIKYSKWSKENNAPRHVISLGLPEEYKKVLHSERQRAWKDDTQIHWETGQTWNKNTKTKTLSDMKKEAMKNVLEDNNEDARLILTYLNNLSSRIFSEIVSRNIQRARVELEKLNPDSETYVFKKYKESRNRTQEQIARALYERQRNILDGIEIIEKPFYNPAENTDRLFAQAESIPYLTRELRASLTEGWIEFDLAACQLSICATLWDVKEVTDYLSNPLNKIWKEIAKDLGIELTDETKRILKNGTYALLFGMEESCIKRQITIDFSEIGIEIKGEAFLQQRFMKAMLEARKKVEAHICEIGGAYTGYGKWLSTSNYIIPQVLAQVAHSYEMKLIAPLFYYALQSNDFIITLYQYDGVSISFSRSHMKETHTREMIRLVENKARELNIPTRLEEK